MPSDLADLTELKIFSPNLDKSISLLCNNKKGTRNKTLELSNPSLRSPLNKNGFTKALPKGNKFGCISNGIAEIKIKHSNVHFKSTLCWVLTLLWRSEQSRSLLDGILRCIVYMWTLKLKVINITVCLFFTQPVYIVNCYLNSKRAKRYLMKKTPKVLFLPFFIFILILIQ